MYRTFLGAVLSLLTITALGSYAVYKMTILMDYKDYKINESVKDYFYDAEFTFSEADGFHVAAAVTSFDGNADSIEDPEIGEIKFYLKQWGQEENGASPSTGI